MARILATPPLAWRRLGCYNRGPGAGAPCRPDHLKTVADLSLLPVWVNPDHLVSSARILLTGHKLKALAVVEQKRLAGVVTAEALAAAPSDSLVARAMSASGTTVQPTATVRQVAEAMLVEGIDHLPVVSPEGEYLGMVTASMLLPEIGRTWDPLTGLAWSDELREWGAARLEEGREIVILFIDLDDFGVFNKRYGHITGDRVLQRVADFMASVTSDETDVAVRYGGDEFSVGTTRSRVKVEQLVDEIEEGVRGLVVTGADLPVSCTVGVFGGRRTHERENVHYAATIDNLINMASKDAQQKKAAKKSAVGRGAPQQESAAAGEEKPAARKEVFVVDVGVDETSPGALTTVMLSKGVQIVSGVHARAGKPLIESVVLATAKALERLFPEVSFVPSEVRLSEGENGLRAVTVGGRLSWSGTEEAVSASRRVEGDVYLTAANATVDAVFSAKTAKPQ